MPWTLPQAEKSNQPSPLLQSISWCEAPRPPGRVGSGPASKEWLLQRPGARPDSRLEELQISPPDSDSVQVGESFALFGKCPRRLTELSDSIEGPLPRHSKSGTAICCRLSRYLWPSGPWSRRRFFSPIAVCWHDWSIPEKWLRIISGARRPRRRHFSAGCSISGLSRAWEASRIHDRIAWRIWGFCPNQIGSGGLPDAGPISRSFEPDVIPCCLKYWLRMSNSFCAAPGQLVEDRRIMNPVLVEEMLLIGNRQVRKGLVVLCLL